MTKKVTISDPESPEKHAEEVRHALESALGEHFKRMTEFQSQADKLAKTLAPSLKPIQEAIVRLNDSGIFQNIQKMTEVYSGLLKPSMFEPYPDLPLLSSPELLLEEDVDMVAHRAAEITADNPNLRPTPLYDLVYDFNEKILTRTVPGKVLSSRFKGGEAKRVNLFEKLVKAKKFVETRSLQEELGCPTTEAVRKLAQGINNKIRNDLNIEEKVIEGRLGFGYRINPQIAVHRA